MTVFILKVVLCFCSHVKWQSKWCAQHFILSIQPCNQACALLPTQLDLSQWQIWLTLQPTRHAPFRQDQN